ncbi:hypothetical protein CBL_13837 [Carabus blaptoides fortunei]
MEKLLMVWMTDKQRTGDTVTVAIICEKARAIYVDLLQWATGTSTNEVSGESFKASRGWHGKAGSADLRAAEDYLKTFVKIIAAEGHIPQQVFTCDETGLFWKKMPRRTYITAEENRMPGHKPMKDRLTIALCANASGDCKIKPLLENNLPLQALLVQDKAPAHPPHLIHDILDQFQFIKVLYLPPNTTSILQPMDQQSVTKRILISAWKRLWPKVVSEIDFERFEPEASVVEEIIYLGKSLGLEMEEGDINELIAEHSKVLTTEELKKLQMQQHAEVLQDAEEVSEVISTKEMKEVLGMWAKVSDFIKKKPEKVATERAMELFNDTYLIHFKHILKRRMKQTSLDRFLSKTPAVEMQ